jgi:hypothetical protein
MTVFLVPGTSPGQHHRETQNPEHERQIRFFHVDCPSFFMDILVILASKTYLSRRNTKRIPKVPPIANVDRVSVFGMSRLLCFQHLHQRIGKLNPEFFCFFDHTNPP